MDITYAFIKQNDLKINEFRSRNQGVCTNFSLEMVLILIAKYKPVLTHCSIFGKEENIALSL